MDRASIIGRLEQAERHVASGAACIDRQRNVLANLTRDGNGAMAADAALLLGQLESTQAIFVADRDRFKEELAATRD